MQAVRPIVESDSEEDDVIEAEAAGASIEVDIGPPPVPLNIDDSVQKIEDDAMMKELEDLVNQMPDEVQEDVYTKTNVQEDAIKAAQ